MIDFTVDGDWVQVVVYPTPATTLGYGPPAAYYESARAVIDEIVAIVAERITAA